MPIPKNTQLASLPEIFSEKILSFNTLGDRTPQYNNQYDQYINEREKGVAENSGSLYAWLQTQEGASAIRKLLLNFGMNVQRSKLVSEEKFNETLTNLKYPSIDWIQNIELPLTNAPFEMINPISGKDLAFELRELFNYFSTPGFITKSGGFVAASKTLHCLFPKLAPMIDGKHTGTSYYHIDRETYTPPLQYTKWVEWLGEEFSKVVNPSPKGNGRHSWDATRFLIAIGINQHIYELWMRANKTLNKADFLKQDPTSGTTGIPRVIDKVLW